MQNFPHHYLVTADGAATGTVMVTSANLPDWPTDAPAEFDGPGDVWSPETMLVGAVANCFILTFRAIARASKFEWQQLACKAVGVLDRVERVTQFTEMHLTVTLTAPAGADVEKAQRLLEKAEQNCLITNSLKGKVHMETSVQVG
ncbi:MAG: OsmC family protein [Caldilineaceae bacterium]